MAWRAGATSLAARARPARACCKSGAMRSPCSARRWPICSGPGIRGAGRFAASATTRTAPMPNMPPPETPPTLASTCTSNPPSTRQTPPPPPASPSPAPGLRLARPRVAILREQGVNSHVEMAYAFTEAGFAACDVHMTDLQTGRVRLADFKGLVACGGFSYGDTLGAGIGWARSISFNPALAAQFQDFFARGDTFGLGVC